MENTRETQNRSRAYIFFRGKNCQTNGVKHKICRAFQFCNRKITRGFRSKEHQTCHKIWSETILR